jgi:serine-type D-Ala-D-Ala carboxypeptidase/endopeptidase
VPPLSNRRHAAWSVASAKEKFFYKAVDAQLDFQRDAGGRVVAVVLHQNGRDMRAQRVANQ